MKKILQKVQSGVHLTESEMMTASEALFNEETDNGLIKEFLLALKEKGETADEIVGLVKVIRKHALQIDAPFENIMDNCGTGGDGSQSFNISTCSAFVIAGAGVPIAKHGNRSISSKTGSADVLEHLGVRLNFSQSEVSDLLAKNKIAFLFAPHVHPGIKKVMTARKELGVPTIFNLIGPLTNPVDLDTQIVGIYRREMLSTMAEALVRLGRKRGIVLSGAGHMDEASLEGENYLAVIDNGQINEITLKPEEVGLAPVSNEKIKGGDSIQNARILQSVLTGEKSVYRDTVLLNAGLALYAHGTASSMKEGIELAAKSIDSGSALERLNQLISFSKQKELA
ncbi:anthranilate phosphoribosyltransferase [Jeotgalibacillus proteolyticus]|uniref:Anthranilate phosphoribosyltransferase n=1 Tax=Jeotgalibacillus proteolyticus TaxID=2082395 RepID=A0A2S5GFQ6_9BACL|nr:anthranilate phosphoribosyltransferase [Jeotgalibacillus proteolyticus]PPA71819.1 anthranilate phosphoribosyltransferase [Jeotgalibacillus proteolyticus]